MDSTGNGSVPSSAGDIENLVALKLPDWIAERPDFRSRLLASISLNGPQAPPSMAYEQFLAWADEDSLAEWVQGDVVMSSPASKRHQLICGFLSGVMQIYVETHDLGIVIMSPFQMKLENGREPDLLFLRKDHFERLLPNYLDGPADLVVEVLSPESAGRDRGDKFFEYAHGGVSEYWLIDPQRQWVEFYLLDDGRYTLAFEGHEGVYTAREPKGFRVWVEWFWDQPLPRVLDALRALAVV